MACYGQRLASAVLACAEAGHGLFVLFGSGAKNVVKVASSKAPIDATAQPILWYPNAQTFT